VRARLLPWGKSARPDRLAELQRRTGSRLATRIPSSLAPWLLAPTALWPDTPAAFVFGLLAILDGLVAILAYYKLSRRSGSPGRLSLSLTRLRESSRVNGWLLFLPAPDAPRPEVIVFRVLETGFAVLAVSVLLRFTLAGI
jgi:hypothetical protein